MSIHVYTQYTIYYFGLSQNGHANTNKRRQKEMKHKTTKNITHTDARKLRKYQLKIKKEKKDTKQKKNVVNCHYYT